MYLFISVHLFLFCIIFTVLHNITINNLKFLMSEFCLLSIFYCHFISVMSFTVVSCAFASISDNSKRTAKL